MEQRNKADRASPDRIRGGRSKQRDGGKQQPKSSGVIQSDQQAEGAEPRCAGTVPKTRRSPQQTTVSVPTSPPCPSASVPFGIPTSSSFPSKEARKAGRLTRACGPEMPACAHAAMTVQFEPSAHFPRQDSYDDMKLFGHQLNRRAHRVVARIRKQTVRGVIRISSLKVLRFF